MTRFLKIPETRTEAEFCRGKKITTPRLVILDNIIEMYYRDNAVVINMYNPHSDLYPSGALTISMSPEDYNKFINNFGAYILDTNMLSSIRSVPFVNHQVMPDTSVTF